MGSITLRECFFIHLNRQADPWTSVSLKTIYTFQMSLSNYKYSAMYKFFYRVVTIFI
jgi:hypothetical protein